MKIKKIKKTLPLNCDGVYEQILFKKLIFIKLKLSKEKFSYLLSTKIIELQISDIPRSEHLLNITAIS